MSHAGEVRLDTGKRTCARDRAGESRENIESRRRRLQKSYAHNRRAERRAPVGESGDDERGVLGQHVGFEAGDRQAFGRGTVELKLESLRGIMNSAHLESRISEMSLPRDGWLRYCSGSIAARLV